MLLNLGSMDARFFSHDKKLIVSLFRDNKACILKLVPSLTCDLKITVLTFFFNHVRLGLP